MATLRWGAATDPGRIRAQNEDNVLAEPGLFVVADGMGGHRAGEVASALAIDLLRGRLGRDGIALDDVVAAMADANTDIYRAAVGNPDQQGMGTTVTALVVIADEPAADAPEGEQPVESFALVNVGDSRTYLLRHGRLRRVTVDHSYVQELVATGHITDDEARTHPRRNIVTRALGIDPAVRVDTWKVPIVRGDRFLLCSDGLVDEVRDNEIVEVLRTIGDPQTAADELIALANRQGGRDNITVVVVDVDEGADPPDPETELDLEPAWQDGAGAGTWTVDDPDAAATEFADLAALVATDTDTAAGGDTSTAIPTAIDTTATDAPPPAVIPPEAPPPRRRKRRFGGFVIALAVLAVLIAGFVLAAAWARRSYFVAFDGTGVVVVYRGQNGGFLWFDPTEEARGTFTRDQLDDDSVERVEREPTFSSRSAAEDFVAEQLQATTTTSTTTTTTTTVPATTTTVAP